MLLLSLCFQAAAVPATTASEAFALYGENNIMEEEYFGIINGLATVGVNYKDVAAVSGFWCPPYVSSDFSLECVYSGRTYPPCPMYGALSKCCAGEKPVMLMCRQRPCFRTGIVPDSCPFAWKTRDKGLWTYQWS